MVPSVALQPTGVPSGTWPWEEVSVPEEFSVRLAVAVAWPPGPTVAGAAPSVSLRKGLVVTVPPVSAVVSQPLWPGPPLQPHQSLVALTPAEAPIPLPLEAVLPAMRSKEIVEMPEAK